MHAAPLAADFDLIRCNCQNCGKRHRLTPRSAGKPFRCRKCGMKLIAPTPTQDKQPSPPPRRRTPVWPWAVALIIGTIVINVATLRPDVRPQVNEQPPISAVVADVEPEPEFQEPEEVAVVPPSPPPVAPPSTLPALPAKIPPAGFQSYLQLADAGDPQAMYNVGLCYETGKGVAQDLEQAAAWYEESARAGNAQAMYKIGLCYAIGKGVDKDEELAAQWLNESAAAGHMEAGQALAMVKVGIPAALAAAWMTRPVGERDKPAPTKDDAPPPQLSAAERTDRQMRRWNGLLGGGGASRQRQNFVRGMMGWGGGSGHPR